MTASYYDTLGFEDYELEDIVPNYISTLFSILLEKAPVRTGNLKGNITLEYYGTAGDVVARIIVSKGVPYARATNDNEKGPKQQYNYRWIEISLEQARAIYSDPYTNTAQEIIYDLL